MSFSWDLRSKEARRRADRFRARDIAMVVFGCFDEFERRIATSVNCAGGRAQRQRNRCDGTGFDFDGARADDRIDRIRDTGFEHYLTLALVHDLDGVAVLDAACGSHAPQRVAVANDLGEQHGAMRDAPDETGHEREQERRIDQRARTQHAHGPAVARIFSRIADQTLRIRHLVHDDIAGVYAGGAGDAADLQPIADVDAGRTDLHAGKAIDAVAESRRATFGGLATAAARLAACFVVADDQRIAIEHRALESRIWTHVLADLLAQVARVAVGRERVEEDPECFPAACLQMPDLAGELAYRREE